MWGFLFLSSTVKLLSCACPCSIPFSSSFCLIHCCCFLISVSSSGCFCMKSYIISPTYLVGTVTWFLPWIVLGVPFL